MPVVNLSRKFFILAVCISIGGIISSCEKMNDTVIDPTYFSPVVSNPQRSTDSVRTTSSNPVINFSTSISVNVNQGSPIAGVNAYLFLPDGIMIDSVSLNDNGVSPDVTANDGIYSGSFNITNIQCLIVGSYKIDYLAVNTEGLFSNLISSTLPVVNTENLPPVIVSTNLPDSVIRPATGVNPFPLTISINATDPDGLCDLYLATIRAFRPNGNFIGNINMNNQGNGLFSFTSLVEQATDTTVGYYKYYFRVYDNSNISSSEVLDSIKFVHP
jgi:hypothetical protein